MCPERCRLRAELRQIMVRWSSIRATRSIGSGWSVSLGTSELPDSPSRRYLGLKPDRHPVRSASMTLFPRRVRTVTLEPVVCVARHFLHLWLPVNG